MVLKRVKEQLERGEVDPDLGLSPEGRAAEDEAVDPRRDGELSEGGVPDGATVELQVTPVGTGHPP